MARYWVGVRPDAPHFSYTPGAVEFQKTRGIIRVEGKTAICLADARVGNYLQLTEAKLKDVLAGIEAKVLRPTGERTADPISRACTGWCTNAEGKPACRSPYRYQNGDLPLGLFVWIVGPLERRAVPDEYGDGAFPETVVPRPDGWQSPFVEPPIAAAGDYETSDEAFAAMARSERSGTAYRKA